MEDDKLIAQEAANVPDARKSFETVVLNITGRTIAGFINRAKLIPLYGGFTTQWRLEDYYLEISVEDPNMKLYKI